MTAVALIAVLVILMMLGVPVLYAFAGMTVVLSIYYGIDPSSLMVTGFWSVNSVILIALPLFIMTGYLMQAGGVATRLVRFIEAMIGQSKSGMGTSMIVACGLFGAISGTASAAVASIGQIMIEPMERHGYPRHYTSALLGISSLLGLLIPPSITMILYAVVTRQSVAACFLATVGPGLLLIGLLTLYNRFYSRKFPEQNTTGTSHTARFLHIKKTGFEAIPALCLPLIILGGIYGGFFTPTEAAAIAVVFVVLIGFFVYRELTVTRFTRCMVQAATTTGIIMIILMFSFVSSRAFTLEGIPQDLTDLMLDLFKSPTAVLIVINIFLVLVGMIMDDVSVIAILSPLLMPAVSEIGIHPVQFAAIIGTSVVIGCNSPPMAPILFLTCRVSNTTVADVMRPALSLMFWAALPVMLLSTFWAPLSLYLPETLGYLK